MILLAQLMLILDSLILEFPPYVINKNIFFKRTGKKIGET